MKLPDFLANFTLFRKMGNIGTGTIIKVEDLKSLWDDPDFIRLTSE